jgi:membrane-associated protease RseP (regulator of RpoE activity)
MWTILGLGALGITLVALPGSSRQKQDPATPAPPSTDCAEGDVVMQTLPRAEFAERLEVLRDRVANLANELQDENPKVRVHNDSNDLDDEEDVQFFTTSGGWLGVGVSEVSTDTMKQLKLPEERGAVLEKIVPDSPAAKAGLKTNDVVLEINGQRVEGTQQFRRMIREIPAGRTANLTIWRDGRTQSVKVTLGKPEMSGLKALGGPNAFAFKMPVLPAMPDLSGLDHLRTFTMVSPDHPLLGIDAESLEGDFGHFFGAPDGEGVLVRNVFGDSPAAKAGLKVGDVITSMDGERVRSASELREKLMTKRDEKSIKLGVLRNKAAMSVSVELPQRQEQEEHFFSDHTSI